MLALWQGGRAMSRRVVELVVRVHADPAPQGSFFARCVGKGASHHAIVVADNKGTKPWRKEVVAAARNAMTAVGWLRLNEPTTVEIVFFLARPPSIPKSRQWPAVRPDLDKFVRSTFDALTEAGVVQDDSRIVRCVSEKRYAEGRPPGATITIRALSDMLL